MDLRATASEFVVTANFIDGTVEGSPATVFINRTGDHTYYGNGCETDSSGSRVACSTRLSTTKDGESQSIGVYYTPKAIFAGYDLSTAQAGATIPDSFCPLGWQLPYSGTGGDYSDQSRSWKYLLVEAYGYSSALPSFSYPTSIILSGSWRIFSNPDINGLYFMNRDAHYRGNTMKQPSVVYDMYFASGGSTNYNTAEGLDTGMATRCFRIRVRSLVLGLFNYKSSLFLQCCFNSFACNL